LSKPSTFTRDGSTPYGLTSIPVTLTPRATAARGTAPEPTGFLSVGKDRAGQLTIIDGGRVHDDEFCQIGHNAGSNGAVTVTGAGSLWNNSQDLSKFSPRTVSTPQKENSLTVGVIRAPSCSNLETWLRLRLFRLFRRRRNGFFAH
jgi:hypothetical protein